MRDLRAMRTRQEIEREIRGDNEKSLSQSLASDTLQAILEVLFDIRDLLSQRPSDRQEGGDK